MFVSEYQHHMNKYIQARLKTVFGLYSVADLGFAGAVVGGGGGLDGGLGEATYYLAKFSRKLHENEQNWTGASKIILSRSATFTFIHSGVIRQDKKSLQATTCAEYEPCIHL